MSLAAPSITVRAPAKVNLQLAVGPAGGDGYHELVSVFHAVSLFDEVTATAADEISVTVSGESAAEVPTDQSNLAARAAAALAAASPAAAADPALGVALHIRKGIPVAGGMAGGSADAAAALVACNELWGLNLGRAALVEIAADLGADVPFALLGGTAVGVGRGDRLTPALVRGTYHWVFALAEDGLSTPAVYAEYDRLRDQAGTSEPAPQASDDLMIALRNGDPKALGKALTNDLEPAAVGLRPHLRLTLQTGLEHGALGGIVCGSGPTCAFLVTDAERALDLAVTLSAAGVCRTVRRATGPVPGPKVFVPERPSR
ncbi:MAG: 4-(cytidine 5'-diphospho)-2-C-methyl-D-erythritol kinase [Sporichthyaceae bacterium]|nr:4-(cytidine 5'-diphospho)-2-C-methyl-D-erythritol kinase [Sporichthyaceae bacterium]